MFKTIQEKISFRTKFFLAFFIFGAFILFVSYSAIQTVERAKLEEVSSNLAREKLLEKEQRFLQYVVNDMEQKLSTIQSARVFRSYIDRGLEYRAANEVFFAVASSSSNIMQLRFLDVNGDEKIRVERKREGGNVMFTPEEKLQNKVHRNYFKESIALSKDELWFSYLNLNMEYGEIERPLKPVIRVAKPIFVKGEKKGVLIINLFMQSFLEKFVKETHYLVYLTDKAGEFILHPNDTFHWSKYLGKEQNLYTEFKLDAKNILAQKHFFKKGLVAKHIRLDSQDGLVLLLIPKLDAFEKESQHKENIMLWLFGLMLVFSIPLAHIFSIAPSNLYNLVKKQEREIESIMRDLLMTKENLQAQENIIITTNGVEIESCNHAFFEFFGYKSLASFLKEHKSISECFLEKNNHLHPKGFNRNKYTWTSYVYEQLHGNCTVSMTNAKGKEKVFKVKVNTLESKKNTFVASFTDITDVSKRSREFEKKASFDELTGIYNRQKFNAFLEEEVENYQRTQQLFFCGYV